MTIQKKFNAILALMFLIIILSLAIAYAYLRPVALMRVELESIRTYQNAIAFEAINVGLMYQVPLVNTMADFERANANTAKAAEELLKISRLPDLNNDIAEIVTSIQNINDEVSLKQAKISRVHSDLTQKTVQTYGASSSMSVLRVFEDLDLFAENQRETISLMASGLAKEINLLLVFYEATAKGIDRQAGVIEKELTRLEQSRIAVVSITALILIIMDFAIAMLMLRQIGLRIGSIAKIVKNMSSGDLTQSLRVRGNDDLSALAEDTATLISVLGESLSSVYGSFDQTQEVKESFIALISKLDSSVTEIRKAVAGIQNGTLGLDAGASESRSSVQNIREQISDFRGEIETQAAMVEESSSSVTQMIASLNSIYKMTEHNRETTDRLSQTAKDGDSRISQTTDLLSNMTNSIGSIQEMAAVIAGVANKTNLLAMNAAIEAAHAGESGRGFAVVAEEIRKLAETASESSGQIRKTLEAIVETIASAAESGDSTQKVFFQISKEISEVRLSFERIHQSLHEVQAGGSQILEAITALQETTMHVKDQSVHINENTVAVQTSVDKVITISSDLKSGSERIETDITELSRLAQEAAADTEALSETTESLRKNLNFFNLKQME